MMFLSHLLLFHAGIESIPTTATADNSIFNIDFKKVRNNLSVFNRSQTLCNIHNGSNNIQLFPEGEVNSGGYIPRREASRYISTALHRPNQMDKKMLFQFLLLKLSRNDAPFFFLFAKQ